MENIFKQKKGITLIALVITIIVLLILAGISILMLSGDNSILKKTTEAKVKTIHSTVLEQMQLEASAYTVDKTTGKNSISLIDYLKSKSIISDISGEENKWVINVTTLLGSNQSMGNGTYPNDVYVLEEQGISTGSLANTKVATLMPVRIATTTSNTTTYIVKYYGNTTSENIQLGNLTDATKSDEGNPNALTIGKAYDQTLLKIGDAFTYTGASQTEWIIFGKDENGNVLLTTVEPVATDAFTFVGDGQHWLSYETDLHAHCAKYGNSAKGITGRSITLKDINRVTGYTEPTYTPITFGTGSGEKDFYYPSSDAASYTTDLTVSPKVYQWWKKPTSALNNYSFTNLSAYYAYNSSTVTSDNLKYVVGIATGGSYSGGYSNQTYSQQPGGLFTYLVASRTIDFVNETNGNGENWYAHFNYYNVKNGWIGSTTLCKSNSNSPAQYSSASSQIRPIVVMPSNLRVEEGNDGVYKLVE